MAESASEVSAIAPLLSLAAVAIVAVMVPSFTLGMTFAPFADLLVIAGLLPWHAVRSPSQAMDAGTALGGMGASRTMALAVLSEPALVLVDLRARAARWQQQSGPHRGDAAGERHRLATGAGLWLVATLLVAIVDSAGRPSAARRTGHAARGDGTGIQRPRPGGDRRDRCAEILLVWFDLVVAMFLPFGIAPSGTGPLALLLGLVCWVARTLLFALAIAIVPAVIGRLRLVRAARMLGVAIALALLAVALLFAEMATA